MYYYIEEMAFQREREIAARTRSPLFAQQVQLAQRRTERGHVRMPSFSFDAWRRWAHRDEVRCTRAAAVAGTC